MCEIFNQRFSSFGSFQSSGGCLPGGVGLPYLQHNTLTNSSMRSLQKTFHNFPCLIFSRFYFWFPLSFYYLYNKIFI